MMEQYEVVVPLDGCKIAVTVDAYDPIDARRAAVDLMMYQFPLVVNDSKEFEFRGGIVGQPSTAKKIAE